MDDFLGFHANLVMRSMENLLFLCGFSIFFVNYGISN